MRPKGLSLNAFRAHSILEVCERDRSRSSHGPGSAGRARRARQTLADIARAHQCPVGQVAIAWLLHLSPAMLPIPGTSRRTHLEENLAAADVQLTTEQIDELSAAAS
ncbi:aldo/keto reductase [Mycolicibacterium fortuitum]|nr:aldo/keto reductase [Mycolicibacterium fortuitum]